MALTDQVLMPGSDYQAICDATRSLTSTTSPLKSGEIAAKILSASKSGVDLPFTLVKTLNIDDGIISFTSSKLYHTLIAKYKFGDTYTIITAIINSDTTTNYAQSESSSSTYEISSTAISISYNSSTKIYTYTWKVAESSSYGLYEGSYEIYGY